MFSAEDDVQIARLQYRLVTDSSGSRGSGAWADAEGITDVNGDGTSLVSSMEFTAGSFPPGLHAVTVRALDTAGNEETAEVEFIVDNCVNNKLGETICQYEEALKPEAEPEVIKPSMSEPPYVLVWIAVAVNIVIFVVALMIVQISLTGPKKKKSGDDDDDDCCGRCFDADCGSADCGCCGECGLDLSFCGSLLWVSGAWLFGSNLSLFVVP